MPFDQMFPWGGGLSPADRLYAQTTAVERQSVNWEGPPPVPVSVIDRLAASEARHQSDPAAVAAAAATLLSAPGWSNPSGEVLPAPQWDPVKKTFTQTLLKRTEWGGTGGSAGRGGLGGSPTGGVESVSRLGREEAQGAVNAIVEALRGAGKHWLAGRYARVEEPVTPPTERLRVLTEILQSGVRLSPAEYKKVVADRQYWAVIVHQESLRTS